MSPAPGPLHDHQWTSLPRLFCVATNVRWPKGIKVQNTKIHYKMRRKRQHPSVAPPLLPMSRLNSTLPGGRHAHFLQVIATVPAICTFDSSGWLRYFVPEQQQVGVAKTPPSPQHHT
ncbi:hypothetical protein M5D96_000828 [Drosophila gunungcola]|uniref:Uncharacterized protein n=1 Tax=Drosophila gunungcola TaxID=103775 RepID=A0A9Q0BTZ8_9MUSC|nr:hypothetical protein M5D96_000828 [Drosophila gunungcola]